MIAPPNCVSSITELLVHTLRASYPTLRLKREAAPSILARADKMLAWQFFRYLLTYRYGSGKPLLSYDLVPQELSKQSQPASPDYHLLALLSHLWLNSNLPSFYFDHLPP